MASDPKTRQISVDIGNNSNMLEGSCINAGRALSIKSGNKFNIE